MSQGKTVITFRVSDKMEEEIFLTILKRNRTTRREPWTFSDFIRSAIREKLDHMQRARKQIKRSNAADVAADEGRMP